MEERRRFVRLDTRLEMTCTVLSSGIQKKVVTKNVGGGGICVFTDKVLEPGTRLQVSMKLPGQDEPVNFIAEVIWSEPYEVIGKTERQRAVETGVRFVEIAPKDHEAVMQHVILTVQPHRFPS